MQTLKSYNYEKINNSELFLVNSIKKTSSIFDNKFIIKKNKWNIWETKLFYLSIKKVGLNSELIKKNFLRNKTIEEIDKKIILEEIKNKNKINNSLNFYVNHNKSKRNFISPLQCSVKNPDSEILPIEFYWSDYFEMNKT